MNAEAGRRWSLLGEHHRAAEFAEAAVRAFQERLPHSAQFNQVHAAEAYLGLGELDHALDFARAAIPMAKALSSARAIGGLTGFVDCLDPYSTSVAVREFRDHLRSELAA